MIPVILYILIGTYGILVVGIIFKIKIMEILAGFMLLLSGVYIIPNGIGEVGNVMTLGIGAISIGIGAFHVIKDISHVDLSVKQEEEED